MIRMPVHIVERLHKMNRAERHLWTQLGREPTLEEIALEANLPLEQAKEVRAAPRATSLDAPVGDEDDAVVGDFVSGDGPLPDELVEDSLRSQTLADALRSLPRSSSVCGSSPSRPNRRSRTCRIRGSSSSRALASSTARARFAVCASGDSERSSSIRSAYMLSPSPTGVSSETGSVTSSK